MVRVQNAIEANDSAASILSDSCVVLATRKTSLWLSVASLPVLRHEYRIGVPVAGYYREILNTDSAYYEGSDAGNAGGVRAEPIPWNGRPWSLKLKVPPLAVVYFKPQRD